MPDRLGSEAGGFLLSVFFAFFCMFLKHRLLNRFFFDLGGFLEAKMVPEIDFWSDFFDVCLVPSFCSFLC